MSTDGIRVPRQRAYAFATGTHRTPAATGVTAADFGTGQFIPPEQIAQAEQPPESDGQ